MFDITIAGSLILDVIYYVDKYPEIGLLSEIYGDKAGVGGTCNIIVDLAKLDPSFKISVNGLVGKDDYGRAIINKFKEYSNINTENICVENEPNTSTTIVIDSRIDKQRTFFHKKGLNANFDIENIPYKPSKIFHLAYLALLEKMDECDLLYGTKSAKALKIAKENGMVTSIDTVSNSSINYDKLLVPALKYTDICVINEIEASGITAYNLVDSFEENIEKALLKLKEYGVSKWIVIHKADISVGLDCKLDKICKVKSLTLPKGYIKGTTGAGDAFCAGILYGFSKGIDLATSMRIGNAVAVSSLSEYDGTDGVKIYSEVLKNYLSMGGKL